MLSKRKRPYDPAELTAPQRLRANIVDMYANNMLSARRAQELINDVSEAGAPGLEALRRASGHNTARRMRRTFDKMCQWSKDDWAAIEVLNYKTRAEE